MKKQHRLVDNSEASRYELLLDLDGDLTPVLEYVLTGGRRIYLAHTLVPEEIEGQGYGSQLIEMVLQDCEQRGFEVVSQCPFVDAYVRRHPQWKRLVGCE